jgi:hypothetical protein
MSVCFSTKALKSYRTSSPLHNCTAKNDEQTIKTENIHSTAALTCWSAGPTKIKLHEAIREMCTSHQGLNNPITHIYDLVSTVEIGTRQCTSIVNNEAYRRILG